MLDAGFFLIENRVSLKGQARIEYLVPKGWIPKTGPNENQRQNNITNLPRVFNLESQAFLIKLNWRKNRANDCLQIYVFGTFPTEKPFL
jgi:hypothetical protein